MVDQEKIHNLCISDNPEERREALDQLNDNFSLLPDKQKAWDDLHRLTNDENIDMRNSAFWALRVEFSQVPDKHL